MKTYQRQLLDALVEDGWELHERADGADAWIDEVWRIRATKQAWGYELLLLFLVDPGHQGPDESALVIEISAVTELLESRPLKPGIANLWLHKGRFDESLAAFVHALGAHRSEVVQ